MSYTEALEAAGATVLDYTMYGSYQGAWMAHVKLPTGVKGFIIDYYGSCSGCDSFESTFGYAEEPTPEKLAEFGQPYLDQLLTPREALTKCAENMEFDEDYLSMAEDIIKAIRAGDA